MLVVMCLLFVVCCLLFASRCAWLVVWCLLIVDWCVLFVVRGARFVVAWYLLCAVCRCAVWVAVRCLQILVCCQVLLRGCCWLFVVRCVPIVVLLFVGPYLLFAVCDVCCLLFAVCCLLFVFLRFWCVSFVACCLLAVFGACSLLVVGC